MVLPSTERALALDLAFGDPTRPESLLSHAAAVEADEREEFPTEACTFLHRQGIFDMLVPREHGGAMGAFDELLFTCRMIARRDLTATVATGHTLLGAFPLWIAGDPSGCARLGARIMGGGLGCLALTEEGHGSDLQATETVARREGDGLHLDGTKWVIQNATRGATMTLLAKTDGAHGPELSLLLLDKNDLARDRYENLAKIATYGIRGADISGIRFHDCVVPHDSIVGRLGSGYLVTLLTLQISRVVVPAFSLGCADTALRATLDFALERHIYGQTVADFGSARAQLVGAFADLLACECVAMGAARASHLIPEQLSVWSAVSKYFVPVTVESIIRTCATVLGARYYLRRHHRWGMFQKVLRDHAVVPLFDGSTAVNLAVLGAQLNALTAHRTSTRAVSDDRREKLAHVFDWSAPIAPSPSIRLPAMRLINSGEDDLLMSLHAAANEVSSRADVAPSVRGAIEGTLGSLVDALEELDREVTRLRERSDFDPSTETRFELASRYCVLHAAAAAVRTWLDNRDRLGAFAASGDWITLVLERLCTAAGRRPPEWTDRAQTAERVWAELTRMHEERRLFSLARFELAR